MKNISILIISILLLSCEKDEILQPTPSTPITPIVLKDNNLIGEWYQDSSLYKSNKAKYSDTTCTGFSTFTIVTVTSESFDTYNCLAGSDIQSMENWEVNQNLDSLYTWSGENEKEAYYYKSTSNSLTLKHDVFGKEMIEWYSKK